MFVAGFVFIRCCLCCAACLLLLVATLCITTHADLCEGLLNGQPVGKVSSLSVSSVH